MIPTRSVNEKPFKIAPPNEKIETTTIRVVKDVIIVRESVLFIAILIISAKDDLRIRGEASLIRS